MIERDLEIVFNRKVAADTFLMGLRSSEMVPRAKPGQFVMVRVRPGTDPLLRRPFSVGGVQGEDILLVLYRVVGRGTLLMSEAKKGARLSVLGPLGKGFKLPRRDQIALLVAGGIGVAPLLFLAQVMAGWSIRFMMGFGSESEIIPVNQFSEFAAEVSIATDDGTAGHAGPVTDLMEAYLRTQGCAKEALSIFTCGPGPMLKRVSALALDQGIPCQASVEAAMACGLGACQGCAVKAAMDEEPAYYRVCTDGPVFPVQAIDWTSL